MPTSLVVTPEQVAKKTQRANAAAALTRLKAKKGKKWVDADFDDLVVVLEQHDIQATELVKKAKGNRNG